MFTKSEYVGYSWKFHYWKFIYCRQFEEAIDTLITIELEAEIDTEGELG